MALGETLLRPTAMLYRNLLAMEAEELFRANPRDGVVLLSGCDQTTPGLLMAAASVDLPAILVTGGPMLSGKYRGRDVGLGTDLWRFEADLKTGAITEAECQIAEGCMARSNGHCVTMGTASTMACVAEALGLQLPGSATWPAVDARCFEIAQQAGHGIVALVDEDLRPSTIVTREAVENAIRTVAAIGGSTNRIIHLLALAGRLDAALELDDLDALGRPVPTLVNFMPSGRFLMEDSCYAGGLPAVLKELLVGACCTPIRSPSPAEVSPRTSPTPECFNRDVIHALDTPFQPPGTGTAALRGNLCPDGAVIKQSRSYTGPYATSRPSGRLRLARDGRMSGTGYGTVVLHVAPEAAAGGPLTLVRTGDTITLDVPSRRLTSRCPTTSSNVFAAPGAPPVTGAASGYSRLYTQHVLQADTGADLDFLRGQRGHAVPQTHTERESRCQPAARRSSSAATRKTSLTSRATAKASMSANSTSPQASSASPTHTPGSPTPHSLPSISAFQSSTP
jgi:dihydroxyacid dehydratase/phosphogluconate dehydratase